MGADRPEIPGQRAAELRPDLEGRGIGKGPVEQPRPPEMEDRENPRADDGEERHAFREAVHRRAQIVPPQDQDRREQARAVGDADPPGIVDEVEAPDEGNVHAPDADAQDRDRDQRIAEQQHQRARRQEREPPDPAEAAGERDFRDRARDGLGLAAHRPIRSRGVVRCGRDRWCAASCSGRRAAHSCAGSA